jgi:hypothetical protein
LRLPVGPRAHSGKKKELREQGGGEEWSDFTRSCALCTLASSVAGTYFVTCCNQCNPIVFVMGFPFKLLEDALLRTVFFILFPLYSHHLPNL